MANVKPGDLGAAIEQQLNIYHTDIIEKIDEASNAAVKKLVKLTKASAPVGERGSYKRNIAGKLLKRDKNGSTYVWYVKPPDHRLTHLLVRSHATKDGGRTKANPFLKDAVDTVLPEYEKAVEEATKK